MNNIFVEENKIYQIDLSSANYAIGNLHEKYQQHIGNFLSDVDWIAESDGELFLIEYKNANIDKIKNYRSAGFFAKKCTTNEFYEKILKKYYGSAFYVLSCGKKNIINFIVILEVKSLDNIIRKRMCAAIRKRLPFKLQENNEFLVKINDFKILSIKQWNEQYPKFPLSKI